MACPTNTALTKYTLEKDAGGQLRFAYECCSVSRSYLSVAGTHEIETEKSYLPSGLNQAQFLEMQMPSCPGETQLINRLRMVSTSDRIWFNLTCIQLAPEFRTSRVAKSSDTFNMVAKTSYDFDQVDVNCKDGSDIEFILSSKLNMNYDTYPHTASFDLQCGSLR